MEEETTIDWIKKCKNESENNKTEELRLGLVLFPDKGYFI